MAPDPAQAAAHPAGKPKRRSSFLTGLNPLETIVVAAIALVALAGLLLLGKGMILKSRVDAAAPAPLALYADAGALGLQSQA